MAQLINQDDFIKTALRLPRDVHAEIQKAAANSGRSMNAEIVARLELSLSTGGREATIEEIKAMLADRDRAIFEESVNAALERFKSEIHNAAVDGKK